MVWEFPEDWAECVHGGNPWLSETQNCQQVQEGDPSHLLLTGEASSCSEEDLEKSQRLAMTGDGFMYPLEILCDGALQAEKSLS